MLVECKRCKILIKDGSSDKEKGMMYHCEICEGDICGKCLEEVHNKPVDKVCDETGIICDSCIGF